MTGAIVSQARSSGNTPSEPASPFWRLTANPSSLEVLSTADLPSDLNQSRIADFPSRLLELPARASAGAPSTVKPLPREYEPKLRTKAEHALFETTKPCGWAQTELTLCAQPMQRWFASSFMVVMPHHRSLCAMRYFAAARVTRWRRPCRLGTEVQLW